MMSNLAIFGGEFIDTLKYIGTLGIGGVLVALFNFFNNQRKLKGQELNDANAEYRLLLQEYKEQVDRLETKVEQLELIVVSLREENSLLKKAK